MTETRRACVALLAGSLLGLCSVASQRPPPPEADMPATVMTVEAVMAPEAHMLVVPDVAMEPEIIEARMDDLSARLDAIQAEIEAINQ
jgi:hypothetical protein